ncbi:hypothetical protein LTR62_000730 [Meristemomyces frigidus]|uniref:IEC3 subunit of the Ino80 complex, chromatin re-modelling-domain-containing protein n=1 Tax=Meristemomyces frigidus TaxID=1508187 RepID=A0AAN7YGN5_9PEZI|nr:hypothetical protein LTR62_000730 [Meristemomyces frigidus]
MTFGQPSNFSAIDSLMSHDAPSTPGSHPTFGGKSLDNLPPNPYAAPERGQPYKSWRKKYRKLRAKFDVVLEDNRRMFREECKLEGLAKRLREELDGLLDICLDLNENPSLPPHQRFNIRPPLRGVPVVDIPDNIAPEHADQTVLDYRKAAQAGTIPQLDLHIIRSEIEYKLAAQESRPLEDLEQSLPRHPRLDPATKELWGAGNEVDPSTIPAGYLTADQEADYLLKLDTKLDGPLPNHHFLAAGDMAIPTRLTLSEEDKHMADMTPRELERHVELLNPQSQHNWLKGRHKLGVPEENDNDNDSIAGSREPLTGAGISKPSPSSLTTPAGGSRKRGTGGGAGKNLAKQVGDRALQHARGGLSPGGASVLDGNGEDELGFLLGGLPTSGKKKGRDGDGAYNPKQGVKAGGGSKAKRKRSTGEELTGTGGESGVSSAVKKAKVEGHD